MVAAENPEEDLTPSLLNFIPSFIFHPALEKDRDLRPPLELFQSQSFGY